MEFDEILSGDNAEEQIGGVRRTETSDQAREAQASATWSGKIPSFSAKVWSIGGKKPKWLVPILLIVGLCLGLVFLVLFVLIGIPLLLIRALIPRKTR